MLAIVGRLEPHHIWRYVSKLRQSASRETHVIRFKAESDEHNSGYSQLFDYLKERKRCGLISSFSTKIKDFYVVPIHSTEHVPDVLMPFNGPGI